MLAREICDEGAQLTLTAAASLLERLILGIRRSMQNAKSSRSCFARIEPMHIISPWASASTGDAVRDPCRFCFRSGGSSSVFSASGDIGSCGLCPLQEVPTKRFVPVRNSLDLALFD